MDSISSTTPHPVPWLYRLVFLYVEPLSTLLGAVYAYFQPHYYLTATHLASAPASPSAIPLGTEVVLAQLANLYLLLCINEALVLRCTRDVKVWKVFLFGLLVADAGHLWSVRPVGSWVYWQWWRWAPIDWGNVPFVMFLASVRCAFFAEMGFAERRVKRA